MLSDQHRSTSHLLLGEGLQLDSTLNSDSKDINCLGVDVDPILAAISLKGTLFSDRYGVEMLENL